MSKSTVHRLWQEQALRPHRQKSFKLSRDPQFLEKLTDGVGVYLTPPQNAVVLCVDEKTQIQALDCTQPGLPLKKGRCSTYTHDYKRHGTSALCVALHSDSSSWLNLVERWFGELTQKTVRRGSFAAWRSWSRPSAGS